tara:strand:+ start:114 stop:521 length:408 start_codon:yes stop_codon:yes gene_type:complete
MRGVTILQRNEAENAYTGAGVLGLLQIPDSCSIRHKLPEGRLLGGGSDISRGHRGSPIQDIISIAQDITESKIHTDKAKGKDIVILIGDTGIGKSTLANALVYGVESLEEIPIYEEEEGEQFLERIKCLIWLNKL